ncbi:hypothetical protein AQUCO_06100037v1 [Aquilegia coerulea]|uniref:Uncharacterized protein n=1 Tax=Aquilegia coerulea TaxID=218851 RepID=A0A2G5CEI3_AQUCA|nr:hypothetical protein AQUCO_06100037v1 [Aquilegia coerulea]
MVQDHYQFSTFQLFNIWIQKKKIHSQVDIYLVVQFMDNDVQCWRDRVTRCKYLWHPVIIQTGLRTIFFRPSLGS